MQVYPSEHVQAYEFTLSTQPLALAKPTQGVEAQSSMSENKQKHDSDVNN